MMWHANPEGVWYPGYAFGTRQTTVVCSRLVRVSYFVYFRRRGHNEDFHHSIWRVRTALCPWSTTPQASTLPCFCEDPLPQLAGLPGGTPTRTNLDWDVRHLGRTRPRCPPRGGPPSPR